MCRGCGMQGVWCAGGVACRGCGVQGAWHAGGVMCRGCCAGAVACRGCGVQGVWCAGGVVCRGGGAGGWCAGGVVLGLWCAGGVACKGCGVQGGWCPFSHLRVEAACESTLSWYLGKCHRSDLRQGSTQQGVQFGSCCHHGMMMQRFTVTTMQLMKVYEVETSCHQLLLID